MRPLCSYMCIFRFFLLLNNFALIISKKSMTTFYDNCFFSDRERDRDKDRSKDQNRDRERDRDREKRRSRSRDKSREKDKDKKKRSRSRERKRSRSKEKVAERKRSRSPNSKKSRRRRPSIYWDIAPTGFEHITPMQYKAMQGIKCCQVCAYELV